jgi:hypothetical protein
LLGASNRNGKPGIENKNLQLFAQAGFQLLVEPCRKTLWNQLYASVSGVVR